MMGISSKVIVGYGLYLNSDDGYHKLERALKARIEQEKNMSELMGFDEAEEEDGVDSMDVIEGLQKLVESNHNPDIKVIYGMDYQVFVGFVFFTHSCYEDEESDVFRTLNHLADHPGYEVAMRRLVHFLGTEVTAAFPAPPEQYVFVNYL